MNTVFDVAKYILERKGKMSTWKLQKLCYYSQAWAIAWTEKPLFNEDFEAWANGPVCRVLFNAHQGLYNISVDNLLRGNSASLSDDEKDTIDIVLRGYGDLEPYALREISHMESPWKDARMGLPDDAKSNVIISKDAMGAYYGSL